MLKGVNDSLADAKELVRLLKGIPAKINLIPFNPGPARPMNARTGNRSRASPISSTRRLRLADPHAARQDILAACGQLKANPNACEEDRTAGLRGDDDRRPRRRLRAGWWRLPACHWQVSPMHRGYGRSQPARHGTSPSALTCGIIGATHLLADSPAATPAAGCPASAPALPRR
jgi:hypothetical protein